LYLTRTLRNATLVRTKGVQASIDLFNERRADALAGLKPSLLESMDKLPDGRLLDGKFMTVNHGLGIPRERPAAAAYLKAFVEEMNASGFVARSIERHGVRGLFGCQVTRLSRLRTAGSRRSGSARSDADERARDGAQAPRREVLGAAVAAVPAVARCVDQLVRRPRHRTPRGPPRFADSV
jgi:hypothetical protein